jgi:hypothetical protein
MVFGGQWSSDKFDCARGHVGTKQRELGRIPQAEKKRYSDPGKKLMRSEKRHPAPGGLDAHGPYQGLSEQPPGKRSS